MKYRIFALVLAVCMVFGLAACSAPSAGQTPSPSPAPSSAPAPEVDLSQNIVTFATGLDPNETLLTVNGEEVPAAVVLYWLTYHCSYYASYGLTPDIYGNVIMQENTKVLTYYTMLDDKAMELGSPLTDEQMAAVEQSLADVMEEAKNLHGLSEEQLKSIQSLSFYYENVFNAAVPVPTEEELASLIYQAKHILISTAVAGANGTVTLFTGEAVFNEDGTPFTGTAEEYNAAALAKAQGILDEIRASADPEATFDTLMHQHSEDARDASGNLAAPDGYTTTKGKMVAEFENAAFALEVGGISDLVKSPYGYHIILRGEVGDYSKYADAYRENQMNQLVNQWISEANVVESDKLTSLNLVEVFNLYTDYRQAMVNKMSVTE